MMTTRAVGGGKTWRWRRRRCKKSLRGNKLFDGSPSVRVIRTLLRLNGERWKTGAKALTMASASEQQRVRRPREGVRGGWGGPDETERSYYGS